MTTPQDIALLDARRGAEMFRSVQVPVSWRSNLGLQCIGLVVTLILFVPVLPYLYLRPISKRLFLFNVVVVCSD